MDRKHLKFLLTTFLLVTLIKAPSVRADVVVAACKPHPSGEVLLQKLLNHSEFSLLKKWNSYQIKASGCYVASGAIKGDRVTFIGYYRTPKSLSKFNISYLVGFENQPSISADGTSVSLDDKSVMPSNMANTIKDAESSIRVTEYVNTFGADDAYIGSGYVIFRNDGSNYDIGCGRYCKTGMSYSIEKKTDSYSLPLDRSYQNFPEIKPAQEKLKELLPADCSLDIKANVVVNNRWDFSFPVTSKQCTLDHREKGLAIAVFPSIPMEGKDWDRSWTERFGSLTATSTSIPVESPTLWSRIASFFRSLFRPR